MAISNKSIENLQNQAMTDEIRDNIMLLYQKGLDTGQVAQVTGVGRSSANSVRLAFERVAQKDYVGIRGNAGLMKNSSLLRWACGKAMIDYDTFLRKLRGYTPPGKEDAKAEEPPAVPPFDPAAIEDAIHVSARLVADQVTGEIKKLGEKIDRLSTVIQSCSANEIRTANANADNLFQEVKKETELLSWIKSFTKPKGNQIK